MAGRDVRVERLDEIYALSRAYASKYSKILEDLEVDPEDFVQDIIVNVFKRKGLDNYDPDKCVSFEALIFRFCRNEVIDITRAKFERKSRLDPATGLPYNKVSMDEEVPGTNGDMVNRHELIEGAGDISQLVVEMSDRVSDTPISPNYDLTWRKLFSISYSSSPKEIAQKLKISESRVIQLQNIMGVKFKLIKDKGKGFEFEGEIAPSEKVDYASYLIKKSEDSKAQRFTECNENFI